MLHIRLCLIHKGSVRGEHLRKGLFQVHLFLGRWFARSGWWHVVMIIPPTITLTVLTIMIITPPLALILVLIVVAPILTLLLWLTLIKPRHILGMLYYLVSRLAFCAVVLSSTEFTQLPWVGLYGICGTLLSSQLFSKLCNMSNQIAEDLVICAAYGLHWCNIFSRPLIGISSNIFQDFICWSVVFFISDPPAEASINVLVAFLLPSMDLHPSVQSVMWALPQQFMKSIPCLCQVLSL